MVLESLVDADDAREHPWKIVLLAFAFATLAVWLAGFAQTGSYGLVIVGLSSIAAIPFLLRLFDQSASLDSSGYLGSATIARHFTVVAVLAALFIGLLAGYVFWQLYLPESRVASLFDAQIRELRAINPAVGRAASPLAGADPLNAFEIIFFHNLQVTGIILLFSALYGAGAIAILSWNASVIATFLSVVARKFAGTASPEASTLIAGLGTGFLGIFPHATFELLAYLTVALAGGVLSSAVIKRHQAADEFVVVLVDTARLIGVAIVFLCLGAVIESSLIGF